MSKIFFEIFKSFGIFRHDSSTTAIKLPLQSSCIHELLP
jgi:hypothetical protein